MINDDDDDTREFQDLAVELLEQCRKTSEEMTQLLLTYELSNWSDQTCLSLAVSASHRAFIANTSCQILLTEMWMGGLRSRRYANLKVCSSTCDYFTTKNYTLSL